MSSVRGEPVAKRKEKSSERRPLVLTSVPHGHTEVLAPRHSGKETEAVSCLAEIPTGMPRDAFGTFSF